MRPGLLLPGRGDPVPAGVGNLPSGAPPLSFCGQQGQPRRRAARSPFAGAVIRASAWCRPITTGHRDWGCKGNAQLPEAGFRKPSVFDSPFHKKGKFSWKTRPGITGCATLLMCDKEAIEVQKILPFLSDTWPLCRIGRAVIRASQSCRQSCNKSQCPACGCRSHHSCTHAPQFSRSFPAREWGSVLQRQGACGQCP